MSDKNLQRMIRLAEEFFAVKDDPAQISVDEEVLARLGQIHPATVSEERDENGPVAWVLIIPTIRNVMDRFIAGTISEREMLEQTPVGGRYTSIYLCSALVLSEYRRKGFAKRMAVSAVRSIQKDHPITDLFFWAFSEEGRGLASTIAVKVGLQLRERPTSQPR